jgi:hypothetical protein
MLSILKRALKSLYDDVRNMELILSKNLGEFDVEYSFVRPPRLLDTPFTGKYRTSEGKLPPETAKVSRSDVADFIDVALKSHIGTPVKFVTH